MEHRPLEGFVFAVSPFNFASIAGNLPTSPALMGNAVVWKPASSAVLPAYYIMKILKEAGMPDGVINMVPGPGPVIGPPVLNHVDLGGVHFTGSTYVFSTIWLTIGSDIRKYQSYPRIVGETGGKDFIFAHESADIEALVANLVRGAFEYQGQKCSAASRAYIPDSLWPQVKERLLDEIASIKMGDVCDFRNFMGAVIDKAAFKTISEYIDFAKHDPNMEIICGGTYDDTQGYFIPPTVVESKDPRSKLMSEEIFGPVLTIHVYPVRGVRTGDGAVQHDQPLRVDGRDLRARPLRHRQSHQGAAQRRRQLLHQRQADWGRRRAAAVRWLARIGHQRQGRHLAQPRTLGLAAQHQGDVPAADELSLSVHGRIVGLASAVACGSIGLQGAWEVLNAR